MNSQTAEPQLGRDGVIRFTAQVAKVQTLADMGLRIVLDLPEGAVDIASAMIKVRQAGAMLEIAAVAINE